MSVLLINNVLILFDGVIDWLINGMCDECFIDNIFVEMCICLQQVGILFKWVMFYVQINYL